MNVAGRMASIPGLTDTKIRMREGRPEIRIVVDKGKAALFGLTVEDIANTVHAQMRGMRGTYYHTQAKEVETVVRLDPKDRDTIAKLHKLTLNAKSGQLVYLDQIADFKMDFGPSEIWRRDKSRMVQVSANKGKIPLGKAVEQIKGVMKDFQFPKDYYYRFGGNYWQMVENQKQLTFALWLTLALVFMVMACLFESYFQPLIIMISVPLAAIGVVTALTLTHKPINIGVLIGAMMLGGLAINSAIILVDYINRLKISGYSTHKAILLASQDRLRPILMTTFTTIFGLIPMALDRSESSNLWSPLAITVIGGLVSSHLLTLFIIPGVYQIFEDVKKIGHAPLFPSKSK
jgi:HAE1 family hydrophobic/amphiphilic exporter-1